MLYNKFAPHPCRWRGQKTKEQEMPKKTLQALPSFCKGNHPVGQASPEFVFRLHPQLNHAKLHAPLKRPITTVQPLLGKTMLGILFVVQQDSTVFPKDSAVSHPPKHPNITRRFQLGIQPLFWPSISGIGLHKADIFYRDHWIQILCRHPSYPTLRCWNRLQRRNRLLQLPTAERKHSIMTPG